MKISNSLSPNLIQETYQASKVQNESSLQNRFAIEDTVEISSLESGGSPFWYPPIQDPPPMEDDDN